MTPGALASDEEVRALAVEILARDPYAPFRADPEAWLAPLRWLSEALAALERLRLASPLGYAVSMLALLAIALGLLAHVAWTVSRALRAPAPEPPRARAARAPGPLQRAEALARQGRFLEASRQVERATLEQLLVRRTIRLARSEPNRVLRRRLREAALPEAERSELLRLLDRLERRIFRERVEDPELYDAWRALHRRVAALPEAT